MISICSCQLQKHPDIRNMISPAEALSTGFDNNGSYKRSSFLKYWRRGAEKKWTWQKQMIPHVQENLHVFWLQECRRYSVIYPSVQSAVCRKTTFAVKVTDNEACAASTVREMSMTTILQQKKDRDVKDFEFNREESGYQNSSVWAHLNQMQLMGITDLMGASGLKG